MRFFAEPCGSGRFDRSKVFYLFRHPTTTPTCCLSRTEGSVVRKVGGRVRTLSGLPEPVSFPNAKRVEDKSKGRHPTSVLIYERGPCFRTRVVGPNFQRACGGSQGAVITVNRGPRISVI